jgi:solute:Na+ symporter, SSS family
VLLSLWASGLVHGQTAHPSDVSDVLVDLVRIGSTIAEPVDGRFVPQFAATGSFVGSHNDALFVAGGVSQRDTAAATEFPGPEFIYHDRIWVASLSELQGGARAGRTVNDLASVSWRDSGVALASARAFGASASHELGLFALGGTDGHSKLSEFLLLRWDEGNASPIVLRLPDLPAAFGRGDAAVMGATLYVLVGSDEESRRESLLAFDLTRIERDRTGHPVVDGGQVRIRERLNRDGTTIDPWQKLSDIPETNLRQSSGLYSLLAVQNDGRGDRLYVISGRRGHKGESPGQGKPPIPDGMRQSGWEYSEVWAYNPTGNDGSGTWTRKADMRGNGGPVSLSGADAVSLGQSHILVVAPSADGNAVRSLSYNAIADAWAEYRTTKPIHRSESPESGGRDLTRTLYAVQWNGGAVALSGRMGAPSSGPEVLAIRVTSAAQSFGWINMAVVAVYVLATFLLGASFVRKTHNTDDYFRGSQTIPWWAAACSIYATHFSTLSFLALPALVYRTDWVLSLGVISAFIVVPFIGKVVIPFYRQIDATSAYEYLSMRFNAPVRLFASGLFTLFHIGRIGIVLALTGLVVAVVTPLEPWESVLIAGGLSLVYSALGGIKGVIWTDTAQTIVMLGGGLACIGFMIAGTDGGLAGMIEVGTANDKFRAVDWNFSPGSVLTLSIWVILVGGIGQTTATYTADQAVVQRYMTVKDTAAAVRSIWGNIAIAVPSSLLFFGMGTALYSFYRSNPEKLNPTAQIDQILPQFINTELPVGVAGLVVAGIFAAAQSTVSTSMNSGATMLVTDFMRPFNLLRSERSYFNAARLMTVMMGVVGTIAGLVFIDPSIRSLMEEYYKVIGLFTGALTGVFLLGMLTRRASGVGALVGLIVSTGAVITIWQKELVNGYLYAIIGVTGCLVIGYLTSLILPADRRDTRGLTIHALRQGPEPMSSRSKIGK